MLLRDRLTRLLPARFVGEEAGVLDAPADSPGGFPGGFCWVVDPHDGTRAFLEGRRGSAVSVALLREGTPVIGVVFAPLGPDRGPDLIAWAEGGTITRNGQPVSIDLRQRDVGGRRRGVPEPWRLAAAGLARDRGRAGTVHAAALDRLPSGARGGGRRHCHADAAAGQCAGHRRRSRPADGGRRRAGGGGRRAGHLFRRWAKAGHRPASAVRRRRWRRCARGPGAAAQSLAASHG